MTGVDTILSNLAVKIATALPYIQKSYGRAQIFREIWGSKGIVSLPKALLDNGDYEYCLPNDNRTAQSYFIAAGHEKYGEFDRFMIGTIKRQFAFTFWGQLGVGGVPLTLEEIKFQIISVLQQDGKVSSIEDYADETYAQVFPEFAYWLNRSAQKSVEKKEADTQWLSYPNAGFRLLFTVSYVQSNTVC